jgi:hypothetical protein
VHVSRNSLQYLARSKRVDLEAVSGGVQRLVIAGANSVGDELSMNRRCQQAAAEMPAPWTPVPSSGRPPRLGNLGCASARFPHFRKPIPVFSRMMRSRRLTEADQLRAARNARSPQR